MNSCFLYLVCNTVRLCTLLIYCSSSLACLPLSPLLSLRSAFMSSLDVTNSLKCSFHHPITSSLSCKTLSSVFVLFFYSTELIILSSTSFFYFFVVLYIYFLFLLLTYISPQLFIRNFFMTEIILLTLFFYFL